jgi:hypothetical protein
MFALAAKEGLGTVKAARLDVVYPAQCVSVGRTATHAAIARHQLFCGRDLGWEPKLSNQSHGLIVIGQDPNCPCLRSRHRYNGHQKAFQKLLKVVTGKVSVGLFQRLLCVKRCLRGVM